MAIPVRKLSGMQKQVLSLYRGFLRAARDKGTEDRERIRSVVSSEFKNNSKLDKRNFIYIEYLLRRGRRQLEQLKDPGTTGLSTLKANSNSILEHSNYQIKESQS